MTRQLIAMLTSKSVKVVMENHYFQIGGRIFKQREGSAIGVDMSVEGASLYMLTWDDQFLKKLKKLGIKVELYFRYVDDIVIGLNGIHHGWMFDGRSGRMVFDENREKTMPEDQWTLLQLKSIANTLDINIQMEVDTPSMNESGRLPVLDLELFITENQIRHSFY